MAIRDWHPGKLVMVWGALVSWMIFVQPELNGDEEGVMGFVWFLGLVWAFAVTWQWFSGRQRSGTGSDKE
jgi:hypothetical protein